MSKWHVLTGVLVFLLAVSLVIHVLSIHWVSAAKDEAYEQGRHIGYQTGQREGYDLGRSRGLDTGYDVGHYDGWWTGYREGFDDGTGYGRTLAGQWTGWSRAIETDSHKEWRQRYTKAGIYHRGYSSSIDTGR